jgi:hypothetical protein
MFANADNSHFSIAFVDIGLDHHHHNHQVLGIFSDALDPSELHKSSWLRDTVIIK